MPLRTRLAFALLAIPLLASAWALLTLVAPKLATVAPLVDHWQPLVGAAAGIYLLTTIVRWLLAP
jgi:hypothetical protein